MLDGLYSALEQYPTGGQAAQPQKTLRMVKNERTAGSIPIWETSKNQPKNQIETALTHATKTNETTPPENALAYSASETGLYSNQPEEFGFGDLLDMVNPLHHLPIVGQIYRELTGDEIKPIGQIVGGALFGGPLGAASGLVNVIVEQETGKDMGENAIALVLGGEGPTFRSHEKALSQNPESRLAAASVNPDRPKATSGDIPGNLLSFVDMKAQPEIIIKRQQAAQGRTAGSFTRDVHSNLEENPFPPREPITQVRFSTYRTSS